MKAQRTVISGSLSPRHGASMEERLPIWMVAANIFNKKSRTADKGWYSSWGLGEVLTAHHRKNLSCYEILTQKASGLD